MSPNFKETVKRAAGTGPWVVVVNDDPTQLQILAALARKEGLRVTPCQGAEEALDWMTQHGPPDLIVTDLHMPEIDGWRFCRLLRSPEYPELNQTPILVTSATFSGEDAARITAELGANAFLPCPIEGLRYLETIHALLAGEKPRRSMGVLVVEDQEDLALLLKENFEAHGYRAWTAGTGAEARNLFAEHRPEIVVIDFRLPNMKGDGLLAEFRKGALFSVFVMITADPDPGLALALMKQGASAYVRKPFQPGYLIALCEKARRERALLGIEAVLEERTQALRLSEATLARKETELRAIHDHMPVMLGVIDEDGRLIRANRALAEFAGRGQEELCGLRGGQAWNCAAARQDPRGCGFGAECRHCLLRQAIESVFETGANVKRCEFRPAMPERSGARELVLLLSCVAVPLDGKRHALLCLEDVSVQKQLEMQLQQAQKLEAIGQLAGGVAHDFNNILTAVLLQLGLLEQEPGMAPGVRAGLKEVAQQAQRAAALTRQLLAFARRQYMQRQILDLDALLGNLHKMLRRLIGEHIHLEFQGAAEAAWVSGDLGMLEQVVVNLVVNARDAIPKEGRITLGTRLVEVDAVPADAKPEACAGRFVCLSVADTGGGMDEATLQRLFEPFFTTKAVGQGTGLGLATIHGIVKQHHGWISVESAVGQGSTFRVYLPASPAVDPKAGTGDIAPPMQGGNETILVVEDEEAVRRVTVQNLRRWGYRVLEARHGAEALRLWQEHRSQVDLVLSDVVMPAGLGGLELGERLRRDKPQLPVLLMSGYCAELVAQGFEVSGETAFLQKPFAPAMLARKIRACLRLPGGAESLRVAPRPSMNTA